MSWISRLGSPCSVGTWSTSTHTLAHWKHCSRSSFSLVFSGSQQWMLRQGSVKKASNLRYCLIPPADSWGKVWAYSCRVNLLLLQCRHALWYSLSHIVKSEKIFGNVDNIENLVSRARCSPCGLWIQRQTKTWHGQLDWAGTEKRGRNVTEHGSNLSPYMFGLMQIYLFQLFFLLLRWMLRLVPISFFQSVIRRR